MTRIAHISDLHFGALEPGAVGALGRAIADAAPVAVVASGDLTMRGRPREFAEAAAFLRSLALPVLAIPGNHDMAYWNLAARFGAPWRRYLGAVEGVASDELLLPGAQLVGVNTSRPLGPHWNWSHGALSLAQARRVEAAFAESPPGAWRGLVAHHPFQPPQETRQFRPVRRARSMLEALAKRSIDFVLAGHLHRTGWVFSAHIERAFGRSVLLIQASTATSSRRRDQPNAFNVLDLSDGALTLTPWALRDGSFAPGEPARFIRGERGLRTAP